jgi:hypothetical protein
MFMKKIFAFLLAFTVLATSFASIATEAPPKKATEVFIPLGKTGQQISLADLSTIRVKEFESLTGHDMNIFQKASFKLAQRKLRQGINNDGTLNGKQLNKLAAKADGTDGFNIGGFALGFFLGLIGVLIAYVISDDKKRARTKWAWIGLLSAVVLYLLLLLA